MADAQTVQQTGIAQPKPLVSAKPQRDEDLDQIFTAKGAVCADLVVRKNI